MKCVHICFFFFSSRRRHTRSLRDWSSDVCSSDLKLGRELDLIAVSDEVGPGLVLWLPKGSTVRLQIENFWREQHQKHGYALVYSPHVARLDLWKTSGHTEYYRENMFAPMQVEGMDYQLKPMNCPFHIMIYKSR